MRPVIGLEIHVQLNTESKLFCACRTDSFGRPPNSNICPICVGDPGVLPVTNKGAVERIVQMGLAMDCAIRSTSIFARKNYFYPDLPKNYQISQYDKPICENGRLDVASDGAVKTIHIRRIHLEEDAGKLLHAIGNRDLDYSLADYNRAGVPLAETVTEPDFETPAQASDFLVALRTTLRALGVSNCDMEKGELRVDVNVSVTNTDGSFGQRVEIKNLNSFKAVRDALDYEIARQRRALEAGERIALETRLWDAANNQTQKLRSKEEASDYRYFPEPDLPPLVLDEVWINQWRAALPELPLAKVRRYEKLGIPAKEAKALAFHEDEGVPDLFDATCELVTADGGTINPKSVANWILNDLLGTLRERQKSVAQSPVTAERLAGFIKLVAAKDLSSRLSKDLFLKIFDHSDITAEEAYKQSGVTLISSDGDLLGFVRQAIAENPKPVAEYKAGKDKAIQSLIGAVMRKTKGQAHPQKLENLLRRELGAANPPA
ncbi:MAG: Asp-tRNA(Asn)/Glu-tRNA(Gln) amidotransferase subunit GatB [Elusimicrobia bacterium]|nr:Asp-tRNA(Asn)/Glu-tRNA(Gln) amidotransferase subunit GatB [Elusimicrobiota bacterium]